MNPFIVLGNGRPVDLTDFTKLEVDVDTVAGSLAKLCRFTGHCKQFYSVAEHSVLVSHLIEKGYEWDGLFHDVQEAIIGDVAGPLKSMLYDYSRVESRVACRMAELLGLSQTIPAVAAVQRADRLALCLEWEILMPSRRGLDIWGCNGVSRWSPVKIEEFLGTVGLEGLGQSWDSARELFIARFAELDASRGKHVPLHPQEAL